MYHVNAHGVDKRSDKCSGIIIIVVINIIIKREGLLPPSQCTRSVWKVTGLGVLC